VQSANPVKAMDPKKCTGKKFSLGNSENNE
jgi:hypothetical protein